MTDTTAAQDWIARMEALVDERLGGAWWPPGLAQAAREFVVHGSAPQTLEIAARQPTQTTSGAEIFHSHIPGFAQAFYAGFAAVPAEVRLRWARLLEARNRCNAFAFSLPDPQGAHWIESLLMHAVGVSLRSFANRAAALPFDSRCVEQMLEAAGLPADTLMVLSFGPSRDGATFAQDRQELAMLLPDFAAALDRHLDVVRPLLLPGDAAHGRHVLKLLEGAANATLLRLLPELATLATAADRTCRDLARALLMRPGQAATAPLKALAADADPARRCAALRRLAELAETASDADLLAWTHASAAADAAPAVQALVDEWHVQAHGGAGGFDYAMPAIDWSPAANRVDDATLDALWQEIHAATEAGNAKMAEWRVTPLSPYTPDDAAALRAYLDGADVLPPPMPPARRVDIGPILVPLAPRLTSVAVLKLFAFFGIAHGHRSGAGGSMMEAFGAQYAQRGRPALLEIGLMMDRLGAPRGCLEHNFHQRAGWLPRLQQWPPDAIWPYFAHHLDVLEAMLQPDPDASDLDRDPSAGWRALALLPALPATLVEPVFEKALGSVPVTRERAQAVLDRFGGHEARIVAALAAPRSQVRALAARWLGRLRHAPALAALEAAVGAETDDVAIGALLDALEALGQPAEKYIHREALAREAPKTLPKALAWFPFAALPVLRWADSGEPVPPAFVRWLLVQAVKQKSPEPNALLGKVCAMFLPADREAFGQFVLEAWLAEDLRRRTPAEAQAAALAHAQETALRVTSRTLDELVAHYLPFRAAEIIGTGVATKGLLAIVAACAGARAAPAVQRYLKAWHAKRAPQAKALVAMLGWIAHPSATQLLLVAGTRFRAKRLPEEVARHAQALAERRGWTLQQLADRSVPTAGFDAAGEQSLDYGARVFTARLRPGLKIELFDAAGKKIAALPAPRQDDDAAAAKEAKAALAGAKKELKDVLDAQTTALHEALCTQREWPAADWQALLLDHPVQRQLAQRLVWVETDADGTPLRTFRPLDDGTLSDAADDAVVLAPAARVRLAHEATLPAAEGAAWLRHLADYQVVPLFAQFGGRAFTPSAEQAGARALDEFHGHVVDAGALRNLATRLGYERVHSEFNWCDSYVKRFRSIGMNVWIAFSGDALPHENGLVALESLEVHGSGTGALALSEVPPVLLAEARHELAQMAASGTGFDADWRDKVQAH